MSVGGTTRRRSQPHGPNGVGLTARPPLHRAGKRRPESSHPDRPLALVIALHVVIVGVLLLGVCTAMPAGVALLALEAQGWMTENTIDLPREGRLDRDLPQTARISSRDGTVLAEIDDVRYGRRTFVPLSEMARHLVTATMATEDRRYYAHPGVDPVGLARALGTNAESGSASQGGSTIERQLTRNLFLADERTERTLGRKVKEALAAVELDKRYTKDELLETYLNVVFYGNRAFGAVRLRAYVSDRGDRLRIYLTDRHPVLYELESVEKPGMALLRFHPDLAFLLGSGRLDPIGLAQHIYRVEHPDLIQVQTTRKLAAEVQPGQAAEMAVARTRTYLDPVREAMTKATIVDRVPEPGRGHLTRAIFIRREIAPFLGIEDALGARPDIGELPAGQVFRIEYGRDGVVKVSYLTGDDDERGRRDPYQLRENERWAVIYNTYLDSDAAPVAWGPGEPSDIAPFPTARDPNRRALSGERSYDYLVANRAIMLTFRPIRTRADERTTAELSAAFGEIGKQYKQLMLELDGWLPELRR